MYDTAQIERGLAFNLKGNRKRSPCIPITRKHSVLSAVAVQAISALEKLTVKVKSNKRLVLACGTAAAVTITGVASLFVFSPPLQLLSLVRTLESLAGNASRTQRWRRANGARVKIQSEAAEVGSIAFKSRCHFH